LKIIFMPLNDIFQHFKKPQSLRSESRAKATEIYFMLDFDEAGAFLEVVDSKAKPISVHYEEYSGTERALLKALEGIEEKNAFVIDWQKKEDRVYLAEHEHLLWQLKECKNVIDSQKNLLSFGEEKLKYLVKVIPEEEGIFRSRILLQGPGKQLENFHPIVENFVLAEEVIYETRPLGPNFDQVHYFNGAFAGEDLPRFFSLLFSYLQDVQVDFEGYTTLFSDELLSPRPALIIEKIDQDDSLYMQVSQVLPSLGMEFFAQFQPDKVASVNELEKIITIRHVEQNALAGLMQQVEKLLKKHRPKGKKEIDLVQEDNRFIVPREIASGFIYKELPGLMQDFQIYGAEKLKSYKISFTQPKLDMKLSSGIDFLEGDVSLQFGEQRVSLFDALKQYRKNHYLLLSDGSHALLNEQYLQKLERIFKKKKDKVQLSFFDLPLVEELIEEKVSSAEFKKSREIFEGFNKLATAKPKLPKVNARLRNYQKQGVKWLSYLHEQGLGGCLADDMGLGKTLQAITLLSGIYPKEKLPSLIVVPKSLLYNWEQEIKKFSPGLSTHIYYGSDRNWEEAEKANLIITTYALVRNDIEKLKEKEFYYVILDESQNIKNLQAQATRSIMLLQSRHRLALSGTPIENNLGELYSLFRFLNPAMFGSPQHFNQHYATPIQKGDDPDAARELKKKIYPFILRRLKKDVLTELPDKTEQLLYVQMSEPQQRLYEERRMFYQEAIKMQIARNGVQQSQFFIFQALNELRQLASIPEARTDGAISSPKLEALSEHLLSALGSGHKALIFTNYLAAIEHIGEQLNQEGIDYVSMTGATRNRQELVERFQQEPDCKVFLLTLKTGGTGLNLTAADMVFIFDPWWNKAAENQAVDRAHRIGQKKNVVSYKMISQGTIEEKILQLQEKKGALMDSIISSDSSALKTLSEEDINFMLSR
jgi:SNF2 family DNA or RNA helicase